MKNSQSEAISPDKIYLEEFKIRIEKSIFIILNCCKKNEASINNLRNERRRSSFGFGKPIRRFNFYKYKDEKTFETLLFEGISDADVERIEVTIMHDVSLPPSRMSLVDKLLKIWYGLLAMFEAIHDQILSELTNLTNTITSNDSKIISNSERGTLQNKNEDSQDRIPSNLSKQAEANNNLRKPKRGELKEKCLSIASDLNIKAGQELKLNQIKEVLSRLTELGIESDINKIRATLNKFGYKKRKY